jgi:hypothetical protein
MDGVAELLSSGGILPTYSASQGSTERSAKFKGVRQGMILFLLGVLLVPIMGVFSEFTHGVLSNGFQMMAALLALICFVGGPVRMLYAALFEEGAPRMAMHPANFAARPLPAPQHMQNRGALPPPSANSAGAWRRPNTAELVGRPSVTENTTRLLDKDIDRDTNH